MNDSTPLPEDPVWENHTANGLYTIDKVLETPSNSEENDALMFMVNRTSVRGRNSVHEVRYYRSEALAIAAAVRHDETGIWSSEGEILVA